MYLAQSSRITRSVFFLSVGFYLAFIRSSLGYLFFLEGLTYLAELFWFVDLTRLRHIYRGIYFCYIAVASLGHLQDAHFIAIFLLSFLMSFGVVLIVDALVHKSPTLMPRLFINSLVGAVIITICSFIYHLLLQ